MAEAYSKLGTNKLSVDAITLVGSSAVVPREGVGDVIGGLSGGYTYIAGHAGSHSGAGTSFGGVLVAIGSGYLSGRVDKGNTRKK